MRPVSPLVWGSLRLAPITSQFTMHAWLWWLCMLSYILQCRVLYCHIILSLCYSVYWGSFKFVTVIWIWNGSCAKMWPYVNWGFCHLADKRNTSCTVHWCHSTLHQWKWCSGEHTDNPSHPKVQWSGGGVFGIHRWISWENSTSGANYSRRFVRVLLRPNGVAKGIGLVGPYSCAWTNFWSHPLINSVWNHNSIMLANIRLLSYSVSFWRFWEEGKGYLTWE